MAWSAPLTAVANAAFTAAQFNASVRDDMLETAPAKATAAGQMFVATAANAIAARLPVASSVSVAENTASTAYAALTTAGPAVAVTCTTFVIVAVTAKLTHNTATANGFASYAISGASTTAASDNVALSRQFANTTDFIRATAVTMQIGMNPGASTFTMQYRTTAGSAGFDARHLFAMPF